jgi:dipeptidase E
MEIYPTLQLALYSDQVIPQNRQVDEALLCLFDKSNPKIGYIPANADPSRQYFQERQKYYRDYNIHLEPYFELDLRYRPELLPELLACDAIHLSGGNTFYFLKWLRQRGMDMTLSNYAREGGVLIGVSAGAILMTPEISTAELCGDREISGLAERIGLELVPFHFLPHLNTFPDPVNIMNQISRQTKTPVLGCPDGGGLIVSQGKVQRFGEVLCSIQGEIAPVPESWNPN